METTEREQQPYFKLSRNEYGKAWLFYRPELRILVETREKDIKWLLNVLTPFENMEAMGPLESMRMREIEHALKSQKKTP